MPKRSLAHDVVPNGAVRDLGADIKGVRSSAEIINVLRECFPTAPLNSFVEGSTRNVLNALHELDHALLASWRAGGETDPAISHDDTGYTVAERWVHDIIPTDLAVIMGVHVDPSWRGVSPFSVNGLLGLTRNSADLRDHTIFDGKIAGLGPAA